MAVSMGIFAVARSPVLLNLLGIGFTLSANIMSYAYHAYQAEVFPTRIRSRAIGFVYSWSRLTAAFAGLLVGSLLTTGGVPAVATLIGGAMIVGMIVIGALGPKTHGTALEELSS